LTCGPERRRSPEVSGRDVTPGKKGRGGEKALTGRGQRSVRERGGRASAARAGRKWAGAQPTREKGKRGESWASGKLGPGGERREKGLEGREGVWAAGLSFLFLFYTQTFKQNYLNSNKFEFRSYELNTRKIMLQHECTNMLTL
jgi:hypothetical protein